MDDMVEHPKHYCDGRKYEPWDVIIDWKLDYLTGTAVKYLSRAGRKDPSKEIEDLQKAVAYINKRIKQLEAEKALSEPTLLENSVALFVKEFNKNVKKLNEEITKKLEEEDERASVS